MSSGKAPGTKVPWLGLRSIDSLVAVALGALVIATQVSQNHAEVLLPAGLAMAATVAISRSLPTAAVLLAAAAATVADHAGGQLVLSPVIIALDYCMVGRRTALRGWRWVDVLLLALPLPAIATSPATPSPGNPLIVDVASVWAFFFVIPFAVGYAVGSRTRLNAALQVNAERLQEEQRERARHAVAQERTRIARELHDVVAHSVSVMVIQTQAARRVAGRDRAAAVEALRAVESCGRDALVDLRQMVGVLHRGDIELLGGAAPALAQLDKLVERARVSGLPVQLSVEGDARQLTAALDLVAFRVVQEALTNAIKHAGPARADVRIAVTADQLEIEIVDTGGRTARRPSTGDPLGHGLIGMQERLSLYGGQLRTGRRSTGGFEVVARIPLSEPEAKASVLR